MKEDLRRTNMQVTPRLTAASSLIASEGYRRLVLNKTARTREEGLVVNFQGDVRELMSRSAYSGLGDSLTSQDYRGPLGGGPGRKSYLQDLLDQGTTRSSSIFYAREISGHTNAADTVLEGDDKPEQSFDLDQVEAKVAKVSVFMKVSDETATDYANLETFITGRLVRRVKLRLENLIINGDGVAPNRIVGFMEAGLPSISVATAGSMLEAVQESIALIESNGFSPSFVAMNPTDKRALYSGATSSPLLIWDNGVLRLHGVPILGTTAVTAGTALVGDGSEATIMYNMGIGGSAYREERTITDSDDFTMSLLTIRAEARAALVIQSLDAFVEIVA